ncbi:LysR substrate-binding domain-containing protein [Pseudoxanthomonas sp. JBR18]|uniref:LysR family transcriptional regulator n=1 Tax=Pseudoxanthomonas sp. JBR18 TaxID=2969308 RepID=UPI0023061BEF|nr:LysR substrate-binding domain-containing protein [Pseudoxanthomonas sp. JBR18]WCE05380.1 LysR substrate-binding domain-containing protein [Pseudoxanthomonas sp. JBR18]
MNPAHGLNLHLLRVFAAVVEHNGFSRAAEALFVSQSAVSKALRELEHQLDLPLIDRSGGRGVRLTEGGQALYRHARGIFAMERAAMDEVRERVGLRRGGLRIGASTTVAAYWLAEAFAAHVVRQPQLDSALEVGNTEEVVAALIDCRIDAGFVEGPAHDERIVATRWREEPLQAVIAAQAPLGQARRASAKQLAAQCWLVREPGSGTREVAEHLLAARGITPARSVEIGGNEAIARAVAAGAGVAILPAAVVADFIADGRLRALGLPDGPALQRPLYRLELGNRPRSPALEAFLQALETA